MESTTEIFLKIIKQSEDDYIQGEGVVDQYAGRIMVSSFHFSMKSKQQSTTQTEEHAEGNVDFGTVTVSRPFDIASSTLSQMLRDRVKFGEARLTVDQHMTWGFEEEREQNAIIVFHLYNGYIADQKLSTKEADKGASIDETIELAFKNVGIDYYILSKKAADADTRAYRGKATSFITELPDDDLL